MAITYIEKKLIHYVGAGEGMIPCYYYKGYCLPSEVASLPTGAGVYNGSEMTLIGGADMVHYEADSEEWVNFIGGGGNA